MCLKLSKYLKGPEQRTVARTQWVLMAITLATVLANPYLVEALVLGWFLGWFGGVMVAHRWYTHRYFTVKYRATEIAFHLVYNLCLIGSIVSYKYQHALHHKYNEDINADPHTPNRTGFWKTTFGVYGDVWVHDRKLWLKLLRDNLGRCFHEYYYVAPLSILVLLGVFDVWLALMLVNAITFSWQIIQLKIAALHWNLPAAEKNFVVGAYNIWWLKPLLMGDELHNNHHHDSTRANLNFTNRLRDLDPSYYVGKLLSKLC